MINKIGYIYGLYDPITLKLRYIGKTIQSPNRRLTEHLRNSKNLDTHLYRWIRSLIKQNIKPSILVLMEINVIKLDDAERYYIKSYREAGYDLTNTTEGGTGGPIRTGYKNSDEHKRLVGNAVKQAWEDGRIKPYIRTEEQKKNQSDKRKGIKFTDEHKKNISLGKRGSRLTEEHKKKISTALLGQKRSKETCNNISKAKKGIYTNAMKTHLEVMNAKRINKI